MEALSPNPPCQDMPRKLGNPERQRSLRLKSRPGNRTIAQSADTAGGDKTDLTAAPSMNAGLTGDAPVKAVADAVSAFASPAGAADQR